MEGLDDSSHLDILSETSASVRDATEAYQRRDQLLTDAIRAIEALIADGYPAAPKVQFSVVVVNDLVEQSRTVKVASDLFRDPTPPATTFKVEFASPTPK